MKSRKIFVDRLVSEWKFQYGVIRTVADWTIILYLIIPSVAVFSILYRSWWLEMPVWIEHIPLFLLFFLLYLLSWNGNYRTYLQEADKVFLIKKTKVYLGLKKWANAYSLLFQTVAIGTIILIILPFFINHYYLEWGEIFALFFFFAGLKMFIMMVKYHLKKIEKKFKRVILTFFVFIVLSLIIQLIYIFFEKGTILPVYLSSMVFIAASIFKRLQTLKQNSWADTELKIEQEERTKYIQLIFSFSYEVEKPVISNRSKPLFFRKSKRIFKKRTQVNGYTELFIKVFSRNVSYITSYFQIISITVAGLVIAPPLWLKAIIFLAFLIGMYSWLSLIWDKIIVSNPLMKKYGETPAYFSARNRTVMVIYVIAIVFIGLLVTSGLYFASRLGMS